MIVKCSHCGTPVEADGRTGKILCDACWREAQRIQDTKMDRGA